MCAMTVYDTPGTWPHDQAFGGYANVVVTDGAT